MATDPLAALTNRYNALRNKTTPWAFFIVLSEYVDYILTTPQFSRIVAAELKKRDMEYKTLRQLEKTTNSEMNKSRAALLALIKKKHINVDEFSREQSLFPEVRKREIENVIEYMEAFRDGVADINGSYSDIMNDFLYDIAANLLNLGYKQDIKQLIVSDKEYQQYYRRVNGGDDRLWVTRDTRGNFIFSETWPAYHEQLRKIHTERNMQSWGAFEELIKVWHIKYGIMKNSSVKAVEESCQNDQRYRIEEDELGDVPVLFNDIKTISENHNVPASQMKHFHIENMLSVVERTHTMLIEDSSQIKGTVAVVPLDKGQKSKPIPAVKIENDQLVFGLQKIPIERGQKAMAQLFLNNAKITRNTRSISRGSLLSLEALQQAGGYKNEAAFRNALSKFREKLKKKKWPVSIENPQTGMYQMEIKYTTQNK